MTDAMFTWRQNDLTGRRFGRLEVIKLVGTHPKKRVLVWLCRCDCGNEKEMLSTAMTSNHARSCGCLQRERASKMNSRENCKRAVVDDVAKVEALERGGLNRSQIANLLGCSVSTVSRMLIERGGRVHKQRRYLNAEETTEAIERYKAGHRLSDIANDLGVSTATVYKKARGHAKVRAAGRVYVGSMRKEASGYIITSLHRSDPLYVMANQNGTVMEHRLVMARHIGRPLEEFESVHHINGDRSDNRIENLQLRQGAHGRGQHWRCCDCGSQRIEPATI